MLVETKKGWQKGKRTRTYDRANRDSWKWSQVQDSVPKRQALKTEIGKMLMWRFHEGKERSHDQ